MNKIKLKNNKGITLVELLVAITILTTVIGITYSIYISNVKYINKEDMKTKIQNEAQVIDSTFLQLSMETKGIKNIVATKDGDYYNVDSLDLLINEKSLDSDKYEKEYYFYRWKVNGEDTKTLKLQSIKETIDKHGNSIESIEKEDVLSENVSYFKIKPMGMIFDQDKSLIENFIGVKNINAMVELKNQNVFSKISYPISIVVTFRNKSQG